MIKWGFIFLGIGIAFAFTPLSFLSCLMAAAGLILMMMSGQSTRSTMVNYQVETNDQHYHLHHHHYPYQKITEGREYTHQYSDGTIHSVRFLKRSE